MSLLDIASLLVTPNAYKATKLYSIIPSNGNGDFTVTRATTATRVNSSGLIESVALNVPRVDYSLGGCPNILIEPQRTNVLLNTVFSGSGAAPTSWTQAVGTGTSTLTASTLGVGEQACSQSATAERPFLSQSFTLVASTTYSYSIYIESISGVITNDNILLASALPLGATTSYFANGVAVSNTAAAVVGRLSITIVVSSTGGSAVFRCGIGTSSNQTGTLLFSRPQLEAGAYSTSFIPTTTASVTRNLDNITRTNVFTNGMITAAGGTWFVEIRNNVSLLRDLSTSGIFLNTGVTSTTGNGIVLRNPGISSSRVGIFTVVAGGLSSNLHTVSTDNAKIAFKWNGTTLDIFVNGVKVVNAASFTPTAMQNLIADGANRATYIKQMALFPTPLTDTDCIALTT